MSSLGSCRFLRIGGLAPNLHPHHNLHHHLFHQITDIARHLAMNLTIHAFTSLADKGHAVEIKPCDQRWHIFGKVSILHHSGRCVEMLLHLSVTATAWAITRI